MEATMFDEQCFAASPNRETFCFRNNFNHVWSFGQGQTFWYYELWLLIHATKLDLLPESQLLLFNRIAARLIKHTGKTIKDCLFNWRDLWLDAQTDEIVGCSNWWNILAKRSNIVCQTFESCLSTRTYFKLFQTLYDLCRSYNA